jgi:2-amino-4-hydroxy-6-hydroxymethyldihydropteridine diphosphokinase
VSRWWASAAWPDPSQPGYLNGVALVGTDLGPDEVMSVLLTLEGRFGRLRTGANGPRTLDLDLVAHGRSILHQAGLALPHPRAAERRFVMGPLAEIAPDWRHPVTGETAAVLAASARVGVDAAPLERPAA